MRTILANQVDKGRLQLATTQNNRARPVSGAKISIFRTDESGNQTQIEEIVTDSSGQTTEIELPAPPLDYSLVPESPMPYSQYNIRVTADGFAPLTINDIQVLPDSLALQSCPLMPDEIAAQQEAEAITIDHHTLYYEYPPKTPEEAVKPLPPPTGFVVLDRVVVPETIVIHDGLPDAKAPNYYLPFRDYIKNVASSEIYSTWPEAAIKANILCILSFTLNRVFTDIHCLGRYLTQSYILVKNPHILRKFRINLLLLPDLDFINEGFEQFSVHLIKGGFLFAERRPLFNISQFVSGF